LLSLQWCLITLLCWPLLLWQGKRVRKLALRLPEAAGLRAGVSSDKQLPPLRLLICGDSAAAGVGVTQQDDALSGQLVRLLSTHYLVQWQLEAQTGLDSAALATRLAKLNGQCFNLVVISVGVNDVTSLCSARRFRYQLARSLQLLQQQNGQPRVLFSAIPPMQHFSALPAPLNYWLGFKSSILNYSAKNLLKRWPHASYVATPNKVSAAMLAEDGFHPSAEGYQHWAQQLFAYSKQRGF
jgi:lysophospholipase L1-like esterase